jgi:hypothetical protein
LVVVLGSNGQRLLMEVPSLAVTFTFGLNYRVSIVDEIIVSIFSKNWDSIEVFIDIRSKIIIKITFESFVFICICIDDL